MKLSLCLYLIGVILIAQENNIYIEYINKQIYQKETQGILIANSQNAIYKEIQYNDNSTNSISTNNSIGNVVGLILDVKPNNYYKELNSNIIYYSEFIPKVDSTFNVYDSIPKFNWIFIDGTEKILGYDCKKADVNFRGSNLTVFYTMDIPIPFGPWKFDGLPGTILKVISNDDKKIYWEATKILYPYNKVVNYEFDKGKYNMSLKDFKFKSFKITESKILNNTINNASDRLKYGKRNFVIEKIFEWEKPNDIWRIYFKDYYKITPQWK